MNRIHIIFFVLLLILQACGGLKRVEKKPQLTTTPEKLQLFVDQKTDPYTVKVDYTLNIPKDYIPSCARLVYSPMLMAPGHEYALTPVVVMGKNYNRLEERKQFFENEQPDYPGAMSFVSGGEEMQINLSDTVPFQLWMPDAKLIAKVALDACDRAVQLYEKTLADGMVYIPQAPGPVIVKYVRKEVEKKEEGFAYFRYPVNGYIVNPALFNNQQQLDDMTGLIRKVMMDTAATVKRIVITGTCSPEGPWIYNANLAQKRAENIREYLIKHEQINPDLIEVKSIAEDWNGLRKLIAESDLPNKQAVLDIIDGVSDPDQREAALRRLSNFTLIKERFYLWLRKVTYEIYYTERETVIEVKPE